ncbi:MAG: sulfotransferase [Actinomycetota bacterium]
MSADPVFIGGLAFSGKTPLRIALGLHPGISLTRKTHLWDRFTRRFGDLGRPENLERCLAVVSSDPGVARLEPDADALRRAFEQGPATYARLFGLLHEQHARRAGARRWGEQLGAIDRYADAIFEAFPEARMIHMIRDPRDRYEATPHRGPGSLGWQTAMWRRSAERAERNFGTYPGRYLVLRYEALAADPLGSLEEVATFIGETCTPSMLGAITDAFDGEGPAPSIHPAGRAFVERYAGPAMQAFGYVPATTGTAHGLLFSIVGRPVNRASMAAWQIADVRASRAGGVA